jgi:hypothetical protein
MNTTNNQISKGNYNKGINNNTTKTNIDDEDVYGLMLNNTKVSFLLNNNK